MNGLHLLNLKLKMVDRNKYIITIKKVISEELKISAKYIKNNSSFANLENWDSMAHINIILALQKNTKKKFSLNEISELTTVKDWANFLSKK